MIDGIIFDMDGVLIDSETYFFHHRIQFLAHLGVVVMERNILSYIGKTEDEIWRVLIPEDVALQKAMQEKYWQDRVENPVDFKQLVHPYVHETLERLKKEGYKIAIASSSTHEEINQFMREAGVAKWIDAVVSSDDVAVSKPHPEIYQKAVQALGGGIYFAVEDSPVGIQAAKGAGLFTLALKQNFALDQSQADVVIENLGALFDYLYEPV